MAGRGRHIIVVGGGAIGTACAYYLSESGFTVSLIDQGKHGAGCSHGNCGYVSPSHVLPLALPGGIGKAIKAMLTPNGPLRIRPQLDPRFWHWFLQFALRCNQRDMIHSGRTIHGLLASSMLLYQDLVEKGGLECEWQKKGMLFVYQDLHRLDEFAAENRLITDSFGVSAKNLDGAEVCDFEPALLRGLAGAWYYDCDAHLRPDVLMASWRRLIEARGVTVHENCQLTGFVDLGEKALAIKTSQGEMPADSFVVATGAWTPMLANQLGCSIPIQPGKGYSVTMPRPAICPRIPMIFPERKVAVTPMISGYRLGSTMEFAGYDSRIRPERIALLKTAAKAFLQEPFTTPVTEEWCGWRPMTYDSCPIIDRIPQRNNVVVAAGHNMLGISMAAATGKLVTELLLDTEPHLNLEPLSLRRFQ